MPRYQLKPNCCFVDAQHEKGNRKPDEYPFPHVFNQSTNAYVAFNDTAGFIARFIVLGVDTNIIDQILVSEYPSASNAPALVTTVYNLMKDYLIPRKATRSFVAPGKYAPPPPIQLDSQHSGTLKLDFGTNPIGIVALKTPIL